MAYQDPWAWAEEEPRVPSIPQTNNTLQVPQTNAQQPQISQAPPGVGDMAQQILVNRAANEGINAGVKAMTPTAPLAGGATTATTAATAAEVGGAAAAATEGAALASTAATAAGTGAAAAEAGTLAAMGPVGWGVGALLLAKQMKWI
jgi:hypothetical protein